MPKKRKVFDEDWGNKEGNGAGEIPVGDEQDSSGCMESLRAITKLEKFNHKARMRKARPLRVLIYVRGGVAYLIRKSPGIVVTIRDFDNENHE